jgi:hypothetical protein
MPYQNNEHSHGAASVDVDLASVAVDEGSSPMAVEEGSSPMAVEEGSSVTVSINTSYKQLAKSTLVMTTTTTEKQRQPRPERL